jgi:hypothetical protein
MSSKTHKDFVAREQIEQWARTAGIDCDERGLELLGTFAVLARGALREADAAQPRALSAADIAKGALRIEWRDTESQARRVAEHAEDLLAEHAPGNENTVSGWVYNAIAVNLKALHAICLEHGCSQGETVADWLREQLGEIDALRKASGNDVEQHMQAIDKVMSVKLYAPERGAIERALMASFSAGQNSQVNRNVMLRDELAKERARIDHIEAHWFDKHGADPAKGEPEGFEWAFAAEWEYVGTQSLRTAIDNEIELAKANPRDDTPVGEPVVTAADLAKVAHLPTTEFEVCGFCAQPNTCSEAGSCARKVGDL